MIKQCQWWQHHLNPVYWVVALALLHLLTSKFSTAAFCSGVGFGANTFMFSTLLKRTQIYAESQSPGEDGPSTSKMRAAPGCPAQVTLVNQHHSMKINTSRSTILLLHILWKDSCQSLPLALGKATFKVTQIYFILTCILLWKASHDKAPGNNFSLFPVELIYSLCHYNI